MKEKKQVTEDDLENLERHINSTKLQLIDAKNTINKSLFKVRTSFTVFVTITTILAISIVYKLYTG